MPHWETGLEGNKILVHISNMYVCDRPVARTAVGGVFGHTDDRHVGLVSARKMKLESAGVVGQKCGPRRIRRLPHHAREKLGLPARRTARQSTTARHRKGPVHVCKRMVDCRSAGAAGRVGCRHLRYGARLMFASSREMNVLTRTDLLGPCGSGRC